MKIVTVVGARPQFIKAAALGREIKNAVGVEETLVHTGQHFDDNMSKVFFEELEILPPKYNLDINSLNHGAMTGRMLEEIEKVLLLEKPDWVLVYGDTNSTLAGALAARKLHIKVAHVEAGLRSFNQRMPEEINRILTDQLSDILFCPTQTAVDNLMREGFGTKSARIENVGDVMFDVSRYFGGKVTEPLVQNPYLLCTLHRQENVDSKERLGEIVSALNTLAKTIEIVLPIHPRTLKQMERMGLNFEFAVRGPAGYMEMMNYLKNCTGVLTDSGGLQKEAYFFSKPCVTLRDETEWVELVEIGANELVGASAEKIYSAAERISRNNASFDKPLYGTGFAAKSILEILQED